LGSAHRGDTPLSIIRDVAPADLAGALFCANESMWREFGAGHAVYFYFIMSVMLPLSKNNFRSLQNNRRKEMFLWCGPNLFRAAQQQITQGESSTCKNQLC
jgi:hypothetical protein